MNDKDIEVKTFEANIADLTPTLKNPRTIKKKDFDAVKRSLRNFPSMMEVREVVIDENFRILGGHQRIKALKSIGKTKVKVKQVFGWTEKQKDEFLIKDNVANGDWDTDALADQWDKAQLEDWGLFLTMAEDKDYNDLLNVDIPHYTPSETKPDEGELCAYGTRDNLQKKIDKMDIPEELKKLFTIRASFFVDFNFQKIADYYAHSDKKIQKMMRELGLVIVRPKEAYKLGMVDFKERLDG